MSWVVEERVTRGPGDHDKDMPQVIAVGAAHRVFVCVQERGHEWCGERHSNRGEAEEHALKLSEERT